MYCPQCGQQQISDATRFCSRCGFLLEGVAVVLATGGQIPTRYQPGPKKLSPRSLGIRQGAMLMLSTLLLVPLVAIFSVNFTGSPEVLVPITAITCFVGGLLRILYALLMQDEVAQPETSPGYVPAAPAQFSGTVRNALPPPSANAAGWRQRPDTGEIYRPPSITENTTRLLNKDDPDSH